MTRRNYDRELPTKEAKIIYVFCEGARRENHYFKYFKELDSRINVIVYELDSFENNSPRGLLEIALSRIEDCSSEFEFDKDKDEVWIVFDTDTDIFNSRDEQIKYVRSICSSKTNWFVAQSNPCFEVWLFYHFFSEIPDLKEIIKCKSWKIYLNDHISGGFDSRKHPVYIEKAIKNAKNNFRIINDKPSIGSTEIYLLSKNILLLIKEKINNILKEVSE